MVEQKSAKAKNGGVSHSLAGLHGVYVKKLIGRRRGLVCFIHHGIQEEQEEAETGSSQVDGYDRAASCDDR